MNQADARTVTVTQAARILGISRGSAYEAAKTGELPVIRIGKRLLVSMEALDRMLEPKLLIANDPMENRNGV